MLAGASSMFEIAPPPETLVGNGRPLPAIEHDVVPQGSPASRGKRLDIAFGFHDSPFGTALLMTTRGAVAGLAFFDADAASSSRMRSPI